MYLVGDSFCVSFKWVVIISTKQRGCSYTECKSQHMLHTLALWGLVTNYREGGLQPEMPLRRDAKSGKVGRTFPNFHFCRSKG